MKANPENERLKRDYLRYLAQAKGRDEATIDRVAKSLARFEDSTRAASFKTFHREQAVAFKRRLSEQDNARTGARLSRATVHSALRDLRDFFIWLAMQPGFRSRIAYSDADYFNLPDKEIAIARARREKPTPTLAQAERALAAMLADTPIARRDRAVFALCMITAARVAALVSLRLKHVNLAEGFIDQDAREVRTKFAKTFATYFMPVSATAEAVFRDWVAELQADPMRGPDSPLFPSTLMGLDEDGLFRAVGLSDACWASTEPVRAILKRAFERAGLPYFNPHSFRDMLIRHAMALGLTAEGLKSWSQNLGHDEVLTTLTSYGVVPRHRQGELIRGAAAASPPPDPSEIAKVIALLQRLDPNASGT